MPTPGRLPGRARVRAVSLAFLLTGCAPAAPPTVQAAAVGPEGAPVERVTATAFAPTTPTSLPAAFPLTEAGCCRQPWWSPDSARVLFVDRAESSAIASVFSIGVADRTARPEEFPMGMYGDRGELVALPRQGRWVLAQADGSAGWALPSGARAIRISHDGTHVAWSEGSTLPVNVDRRLRTIWLAEATGEGVRWLTDLTGGDILGWGPDDAFLVASGIPAGEESPGLWRIHLDGEAELLMEAARVRGPALSPDGGWLTFMVAFSGEAPADGLWVANTGSGEASRLDVFGAYRWRDESRLLIVPLTLESAPSLAEFDVTDKSLKTLLPSGSFTGGIGNNAWQPSPDGRWIVYQNAVEGSLWVVALP